MEMTDDTLDSGEPRQYSLYYCTQHNSSSEFFCVVCFLCVSVIIPLRDLRAFPIQRCYISRRHNDHALVVCRAKRCIKKLNCRSVRVQIPGKYNANYLFLNDPTHYFTHDSNCI